MERVQGSGFRVQGSGFRVQEIEIDYKLRNPRIQFELFYEGVQVA